MNAVSYALSSVDMRTIFLFRFSFPFWRTFARALNLDQLCRSHVTEPNSYQDHALKVPRSGAAWAQSCSDADDRPKFTIASFAIKTQ